MHTNMDGEQNKSEEINVAGVTCLLAAQMEALIERWGIFSFPNQEPPLTSYHRQEQLGRRLVAMTRRSEERKEEINTWQLENINCRVRSMIDNVKEENSFLKDVDTAEHRKSDVGDEELASNAVEESDKAGNKMDMDVDKEADMEETSRAGRVGNEEVPFHLTAAAGTFLASNISFKLAFASIGALVLLCLYRQYLDN